MKAHDLIRALEATGLTHYRISKETGISQPTISRIAGGQPDVLASTMSKLEALCRAKGIKIPAPKKTAA